MWRVWLCLGILGCPKRGPSLEEQVEALLQAADRQFEERGTLGLEASLAPLREAFALDATHPGIAWRLSRLQLAQGLAAEEESAARAAFADARASADRCLLDEPAFAARRASQGWAVALETVSPERRPCVAWLALAWVRWTIAAGPVATSLDLEPIDALLQAASAWEARELRSLVVWARGLSLAVRPSWAGQDLARADALLEEAIRLERSSLVRQADRYRFVLVPMGSPEADAVLAQILQSPAETPEERQVQAELRSAGPGEPGSAEPVAVPER